MHVIQKVNIGLGQLIEVATEKTQAYDTAFAQFHKGQVQAAIRAGHANT